MSDKLISIFANFGNLQILFVAETHVWRAINPMITLLAKNYFLNPMMIITKTTLILIFIYYPSQVYATHFSQHKSLFWCMDYLHVNKQKFKFIRDKLCET